MINNIYIPKTGYLQTVVQIIWQIEGVVPYQQEYIVPKGIVEIIFNFGDNGPVPAELNDKHYQLSKCFINGYNTCPISLQLPGKHHFFGVQMQPATVKNIFGLPAAELSNTAIDLTLVDPYFLSLWHQLAAQITFDGRVSIIKNWLQQRPVSLSPQELALNNFLGSGEAPQFTVPQLARELCYSPRHLNRVIQEITGLNTETTLLYKKFLHAVNLVHFSGLGLGEIAYQCGFSDQSHFIRTFKTFAQITPGTYRQNKGMLPGHVYQNVR